MNEKEHGACGGGDDTTAATNSDKITYNETFFNDANQSNNSNFNPLRNEHITCYKKSLYDSLLREEEADGNNNDDDDVDDNKSKSEASASFCRDGYVTNQRYQTFKDNKRSEMQRTNCYDEVFPAEQEAGENSTEDDDDDDDDEDLYNDGEIIKTNTNRSASSSSSSLTETTLSKSVVIQMNEDNEDEDDDYMGKKKFENLIQKQELENIKKKNFLLNSAAVATAASSSSSSSMANKYDQEKNLLEKFQNECRLGSDKTTESVMKAKSVLIKLDMSTTSDRYSSILNSRE